MSKRKHEGYILVDHRESPGVPVDVTGPAGKNFISVAKGQTFESATVTCAHCNVIVVLNPNRTRERGYCQKCDQYVCDNPMCSQDCRSFNRLLDTLQEQAFKNLNLSA